MATEQEKELFASAVLTIVGREAARLPSSEVTGFLSMEGRLYDHALMVVGRAVNGWDDVGVLPSKLALRAAADVVKYMRVLCQRHGIKTEKDKPLHSLIGEYVKRLKDRGYIESEMTERILKSSISILEAFNRVRNDQSFAHDNQLLNYDESLLIFNHITSTISFIEAVERRILGAEKQSASISEWENDILYHARPVRGVP